MEFEYLKTERYEDTVDIEDIGNFCLQAFTDEGAEYYLMASTELGWTTFKTFGPLAAETDDDGLHGISYSRFTMEYKEQDIKKEINFFLHKTAKGGITQVFEISHEEAYKKLKTIKL